MSTNLFRSAAVLVLLPLWLSGCREMAVPPAGSYSEILLVTDDGRESRYVPEILPWLSVEHDYIIEKEKPFDVSIVKASDMPTMPVSKNILICAVADPLTDAGKLIATWIGEVGMRKVRSGQATLLKKENVPQPGQLTVILTASERKDLEKVIAERGPELESLIESSCRQRLRRHLLTYEDKEITKHLWQNYGFVIEVPTLYKLLSEKVEPPGVELLREAPTRLIGVFWTDMKKEPTLADEKTLFNIRREYVWQRYDKDAMDSTRVWFSETNLADYPAILMEGYWYNTKATAGGYYMTYFVYQAKQELLWAVDLLAYAPGHPKHTLFREMLALAETFRYE
jgi:hypothetical protein